MKQPDVTIVFPVMNEVENVSPILAEVYEILAELNLEMEVIFVCDPSSDGTEYKLRDLARVYPFVKTLFMAERVGQTEAIRAGYENATGKAVISMDADYQDPPYVLKLMIEQWKLGALIVHTRRIDRSSDRWFYRNLMGAGYRILKWATKGRVQEHVGDFRLLDSRILPLVLSYEDPQPFWRGITSLSGVPSKIVEYDRPARKSGSTKYSSVFGSPAIAFRAMASFSNRPLQFIQALGILFALLSLLALISILLLFAINPSFPRGIPTLIVTITLFFSIQFFSMAILATYLGVVVEQTRRRKNYLLLPKDKFFEKV